MERFLGNLTVMAAFARAGKPRPAAQQGLAAYALVNQTPDYAMRVMMATNPGLTQLAFLLSGQKTGRATIDSLLAVLTPIFTPSSAILARDTALHTLIDEHRVVYTLRLKLINFIGRPAAPFVATHWFNQSVPATVYSAAPNAHVKPMDDGVIRILVLCAFGCPHCIKFMHELQRMQTILPTGVEIAYYVQGVTANDPNGEAESFRHVWLDRQHYTFPLAVWAGPLDTTADGGLIQRASPVMVAYGVEGTPTILVIDGHGIVRYGTMGEQHYRDNLEGVISELLRERAAERGTATALDQPAATRIMQ
jgi:hypothetical protein